ncbi:MAG: hypothetical protein N3G18_03165, partial [Candidatus Saccharicenans sp.]|nr:hypothetical protein [Candidatus Saccharicenans sp.]
MVKKAIISTLAMLVVLFFLPGLSGLRAVAGNKPPSRPVDIDKEALKKLQEQKVIRAIRLNEPVKLDGLLEEAVWK